MAILAPRVLIVDDDIDLAEVTCEALGLAGLPAIYCTTVIEATDTLARHAATITAVLTDINLGSPLSGIELAIFVAAEWPHVSICVTSGLVDGRPKRLPDKAAFMAKPWRTAELLAHLETGGTAGSPPSA